MTAATRSPEVTAPQPGAGVFPYEDPVDPASVGVDPRRAAAVAERFRRQHADGAFPGGQLVARRRGRVVLSVVTGVARGARPGDGEAPLQVGARTPFPVYSAGKPVAAIAVAILESRGLLDVTAPIARVVPEFAGSAHAEVTTLEVLNHTAGLVVPAVQRNVEQWGDRKAMLRLLLESRPLFRRGTFAYMPFEYGWVLSELVERIDGRPLPDFVAQEIAGPLGLPALAYGFAGRDPGAVARSYWLGKDREMVAGMNVADGFEELNNARAFFECRNPAYTMISDAATLAAWYEALVAGGVARDGRRILPERLVRAYTRRSVSGWNRSIGTPMAVGRGFQVGSLGPSMFGWWNTGSCFGHGGVMASAAFGDTRTGVSAAIITNGSRSVIDLARRVIPLAQGLRAACG